MSRLPMSRAAAGLFRGLLARSGKQADRILLTDYRSTDWQSLTFVGERHHFALRFRGDRAGALADTVCAGLEDAEFAIRGQIVADVHVAQAPAPAPDGGVTVAIEALTIED